MAEPAKIQLFGVKELDNFFETMKRADQRRLILASFRIGAKPLIQAARQNLKSKVQSRSTGTLNKSMGFIAGRSRGKSVFVNARVGARKFGNYRGFHGHLFDAGTKQRTTNSGKNRGRMPATRFFTNALTQAEPQMIADSQDNILKALDKMIQRNLKRINKPA